MNEWECMCCGAAGGEGCWCCTEDYAEDCMGDHKGGAVSEQSAKNDAHRRVVNPDSIDTCTGCEWESWDTAPTFAEHTLQRCRRAPGELTPDRLRRFIRAENKVDAAKEELRRVVVEILAEGASFSEVSKATGLSTNTLQRWKRVRAVVVAATIAGRTRWVPRFGSVNG